ncbi:MAG TPA: glycoside hydrolase family 9 protein [Chthonomonadales bacterium]|nr:glycoside hydrolase family 9 protein [Chthonomonadales bacterium]
MSVASVGAMTTGRSEGTDRGAATVWLDDLPHGFIANTWGPPRPRLSHGRNPITVAGRRFERGLGVRAPARIEVETAGRATRLRAWTGVDQEVSQQGGLPRPGAEVEFRVFADGRERWRSGWMTDRSPARRVDVDLRGVQHVVLEVVAGPDDSPVGHANWAAAELVLRAGQTASGLRLEAPPRGLLMTHAGFLPGAAKTFTVHDDQPRPFAVRDAATGEVVHRGRTARRAGDWGVAYRGDFSAVKAEGVYWIECGDQRSRPIAVRASLHRELLARHLNWFLWQRCGDPENGWERGQHADDGRRRDNGQHHDVRGGWHDAADLRKWGMTINGQWALTEWALTLTDAGIRPRVLDEIRWGNRYFLAMQEPAGYMMSHVGGDVERHGDSNRFTDNIVGTADDRVIVTDPAAPDIQFVFVLSQANAATVFATDDPAYAARCREAAVRAWRWALREGVARGAYPLGAAVAAGARLATVTGDQATGEEVRRLLRELLALQDTGPGPVTGFWYADTARTRPAHLLHMGNLPLWGLVLFAEAFPGTPEAADAVAALRRYADGWLAWGLARSTHGQVPYALYETDPGGGRRAGRWFYRWCFENREDGAWWNGVNPHLASTGAAMVRMSRLLSRPDLRAAAQRQLDFVYGANPFDASWATGIGTNQPEFFKTSEFTPHTPLIVGAVMAGIGSCPADQPVLLPGWWQTTEYWMQAVAPMVKLLHDLDRTEPPRPS